MSSRVLSSISAKNTWWMIGEKIGEMLLSLIVGALTARFLGPSNYGLISYSASLITLFSCITQLGLNTVAINELIKNRSKEGEILGSILVLRLFSALISYVFVLMLVKLVEPENNQLFVITLIQGAALIFNVYETFAYWFKAKQNYKYVAIATFIAMLSMYGWKIAQLINGSSVEWFSASSLVKSLVCLTAMIILFKRNFYGKLYSTVQCSKNLIKQGSSFILTSLAITLYTQADKIMIGKMLGESEVGFYTTATTIAYMWEFIPTALITSISPVIMSDKKKNKRVYQERIKALLFVISALGFMVSLGFFIFGKLVVSILYGQAYFAAIIPLKVIVVATGFALLGTARSPWIVCEGLNRYSFYYTVIGAIFNIILNYYFIPKLNITGAALATLISQIIVAVVAPLLFKKTRPFVWLYFKSFDCILKVKKTIKLLLEDTEKEI